MDIFQDAVATESFTMRYFRFGQGEKTFVILPGISVQSVTLSAEAVAEAYAGLAERCTVYVFDRRETLPDRYTVEDMADDTAEAMAALGLRGVYLFGASQGGMMALVIAIRHPELVGKLVLGSTSSHITDEQFAVLSHWAELARKKDRVGLYLDFGEKVYPPAVFSQWRDALIAAAGTVTDAELERFVILAEGTRDFNVTDQLDRIQCPVLAIGSYEDAVLDADATMEIAEILEQHVDLRLYMYTGFGHAAFDTAPDYRKRIREFLEL